MIGNVPLVKAAPTTIGGSGDMSAALAVIHLIHTHEGVRVVKEKGMNAFKEGSI